MTYLQTLPDKKIAIVDDEENLAEATSWEVEEAGFKPWVIVENSFIQVEDLASYIAKNAQYAVCDHRLSPYGLANFYGSELVAILYDFKIPSILITQYTDMDIDVSIRKHRRKIPIILDRENVNSLSLKTGIEDCILEINGRISRQRKPYRTLVRVEGISEEAGEKVIDAIIPGWNPRRAVRFPASIIPEALHSKLATDVRLVAHVNIGANSSEDLYFDKFELAPEPDDIYGLT
ncbi:MAG: hypothetical protein KME08_12470 [Aphanothece sp. CMT-3BRIN-NPC111]|jgi:hypothetical protein|nr:hypothetical protein [Aphanothece sp. CMT-3BRIN-NPC111]